MANYTAEKRTTFLITLLAPIFGLFQSIYKYRLPYAKNLFWIFCMFYGMVHIYSTEGTGIENGTDSVRYAQTLTQMHDGHFTATQAFEGLYAGESNATDPYVLIITFLVSRLTGNAHWLFFTFALIYGYFYSRNIWYLIDQLPRKLGFVLGIFVVSFAMILPIWSINGVRMWTAMQIFIYGLMPYIINNDKSKLWWTYGSFLIHFSFILPIILFLAYRFIPKKKTLLLIIFILTFTIQELDLSVVRESVKGLFGGVFDSKIGLYANEGALERSLLRKGSVSGHVILARGILQNVYRIMLIISYFVIKNNTDKRLNNLYCIAIYFYSFANIMSLIPSGGRFNSLAQMLSAIFLCFAYLTCNYNYKKIFKVAAVLLIFPIIFAIRAGMDFWGLPLLIGNPIDCWFMNDKFPIIYFIK